MPAGRIFQDRKKGIAIRPEKRFNGMVECRIICDCGFEEKADSHVAKSRAEAHNSRHHDGNYRVLSKALDAVVN